MSYGAITDTSPYGLVAEFDTPEALVAAADAARVAGFKKMDAYTPFPVHGLSEAIGFRDVKVPFLVFGGGLCGAMFGHGLQYYVHVLDYPLNVGGRPLYSLPAMVPITFEPTILFSALTATFGMLALNGLPKLYHSIFNTPGFLRASQDRFFLAIESKDKQYDSLRTREFLEGLNPLNVSEVER